MAIKKILTVAIGMAGGFPIDGKPKEKTAEKMHPEILKRWIIFVAIVIVAAAILLAGASYVVNQPANVQPAEQAATMLSSSSDNGQQVIGTEDSQNLPIKTSEWYPLSTTGKIEFSVYGTAVLVGESEIPNTQTYVRLLDHNLKDRNQELLVRIRYKNTATGEIVEGNVYAQGAMSMGDQWSMLIKNVDPSLIQWQPEFGIKNLNTYQPKKVNLQ